MAAVADDYLEYSPVSKTWWAPLSGGRAALGRGKKVIGGFVWMKINFARLGPEREATLATA